MSRPASRLAQDLILTGQSGTKTPKLIYGTAWKKEGTANLVYQALKAGFRGIDTAAQPKHYDERGVGAGLKLAVKDGIVRREDLFVQTKFTSPDGQSEICPYDVHAPLEEKVHQSVRSSLANFTIGEGEEPYLDSVVLHSPLRTPQDTMTAWKTLESYVPNKIRNLGIANTTLPILETILSEATIKPSVVQNRFHQRTDFEVDLRALCREKGIIFQSFWTITANGPLLNSKPVQQVCQGAGVEPVPAYYSLLLGLGGVTILDGTTKELHMKADLEGIQQVGAWAEGSGSSDWISAFAEFKQLIGEAQ